MAERITDFRLDTSHPRRYTSPADSTFLYSRFNQHPSNFWYAFMLLGGMRVACTTPWILAVNLFNIVNFYGFWKGGNASFFRQGTKRQTGKSSCTFSLKLFSQCSLSVLPEVFLCLLHRKAEKRGVLSRAGRILLRIEWVISIIQTVKRIACDRGYEWHSTICFK